MAQVKFGFGASARRVEDAELTTGHGTYLADLIPEGVLVGYVLRSPYGHADFKITSLEAAKAVKGVKLILTYEDIKTYGSIPLRASVLDKHGQKITAPDQPMLANGVVKHVGDGVAFIVATTINIAKDASELIEIDWQTRPVVVHSVDAVKPNAPLVHEAYPNNIAGVIAMGDKEKTEKAFTKAHKIIELEIINNRQIVNFMETRGAIGEYDKRSKRYTLTVSTQGSHGIQANLAANILHIPKERLRVITPEVGGGFGTKIFMYREYPLVLIAAERLNKAVAWVGERSEHFLSCSQGRDHVSHMQAAVDKRGKILGAKVQTLTNMGGYLAEYSTFIPWIGATMQTGVYDIPTISMEVSLVFTNTVTVDAYRGAGRPEATYLIERMIDKIGQEMGISPFEIRRRNFISPTQMPYKTALNRVYDSGEFDGHMTKALDIADYAGFKTRAKLAKKKGLIRGFGVSTYIEACGGGGSEDAWTQLEKDGSVTVLIGTQNNGQGHKTAYAQLVAEHLDIPLEKVKVVQGDTDIVPKGSGTGGSRSLPVGGAALNEATQDLVLIMKQLASVELEASIDDLEVMQGRIKIAGTDRELDYATLASLPGAHEKLKTHKAWAPPEATYPNGTHAIEVEIDPETGHVAIVNHVIVDDFGRMVNPLLLAGQVHGGSVQGIGQALMERVFYDETGQLLTASLMDYALPRARDVPMFNFTTRNVPCTTNPLGIKGAGEAGTIGAVPAIMNALGEALFREYGVKRVDMPATPEVIVNLINGVKP